MTLFKVSIFFGRAIRFSWDLCEEVLKKFDHCCLIW